MPRSIPLSDAAPRAIGPFEQPFKPGKGGRLHSRFGAFCHVTLAPGFVSCNLGRQFDPSKREVTLFAQCEDTDIEEHMAAITDAGREAATRELGKAPSKFTECLTRGEHGTSLKISLTDKTQLFERHDLADGAPPKRTPIALDELFEDDSEWRSKRLVAFVKILLPTVWAKKAGDSAGVKVRAARVTFMLVGGDDDDDSSDDDDDGADLEAGVIGQAAKRQRRE